MQPPLDDALFCAVLHENPPAEGRADQPGRSSRGEHLRYSRRTVLMLPVEGRRAAQRGGTVGRGKPVDRSLWPPEGTHRRFLELLDKVHRDNGTKSLRVIAASMHLRAHSRVDMLLRGQALPADDNQAENLIRA